MANLNQWITTVSKEDADTAYEGEDVTIVESEPVTEDIESVEDVQAESDHAAEQLEDAVEAQAAIEAYIELVRGEKARGRQIDAMTAKAIYIGLEGYGVGVTAMPSVESFGSLSVSVELLDKLKDGAKAVGNKIKELYEYIVNLIKRAFGSSKEKAAAAEEKIAEKVKEVKSNPEAKSKPASFNTESANLLYADGKFIGDDAKKLKDNILWTRITLEHYLDGIEKSLKVLYLEKGEKVTLDKAKADEVIKLCGKAFKAKGEGYSSEGTGLSTSAIEVSVNTDAPVPSSFFKAAYKVAPVSGSVKVELSDAGAFLTELNGIAVDIRKTVTDNEKYASELIENYEDISAEGGGEVGYDNGVNQLLFLRANFFAVNASAISYLATVADQLSKLALSAQV